MRVEYTFELSEVDVPRFSVEATEGIGKLFTLSTLVLNALATRRRIEIVFHGLNPEDPHRRIEDFQEILRSSEAAEGIEFTTGKTGRVRGSSASYEWLALERR